MSRAEENMYGGNGGVEWDDKGHNGVKRISVVYGTCIYSIRVLYGDDVEREITHGGEGTTKTVESPPIELDYPREYLTMVSGHYHPVNDHDGPMIKSLTFKSNKRTYEPIGKQTGTAFSFPESGARVKILAFKGRSGRHLNAIGFHSEVQLKERFRRPFSNN